MRFQRLFLTTLLLLTTSSFAQAEEFEFHHEFVLGTSMELKVNATSRELAQQAETLALVELDRLTAVFSHYDPSSEFSRFLELRPGATTEVSRELFEALRVCQEWMKVSEGSFHPAVERLTRQWQDAEQRNTLPASPSLEKAVREINQLHWRLANDSHQVTRASQVPLSLNAIAKGIVLDRVVESVLDSIPVQGIMLNIGGDVRVAGQIKVDVAIADPNADTISSPAFTHICLTDGAIATSGTSERFFAIDGKRYSHILDPRTGLPVSEVVSSTVIADCASTADVVATICSVLPIRQSLALVNALPGVDCLLISSTGLVAFSENFPQDENGDGETTEKQEAKAPAQTELTVEFEISKPESSRRYARPYVAVWIEDKDGFPVKTLSLFLMQNQPGPRWYRDLRRWYSDDQLRKLVDTTDLITTVSKPTRNPGVYKVSWDGKDDSGKELGRGDYTLLIEAAREHGTYQLIKHQFELGGDAFKEALKGNVEISAAVVKYRSK